LSSLVSFNIFVLVLRLKFIILIFIENNKFDSINWIVFKIIVIIATEVWKVGKYLSNSICNMTTLINLMIESLSRLPKFQNTSLIINTTHTKIF